MHGRKIVISENGRILRIMETPKDVAEAYGIKLKSVYNALERGGKILRKYKLEYSETKMERRLSEPPTLVRRKI